MQNESLEDIARAVLTQYDVNPTKIQIVQQGGIKTVWKVFSTDGMTCLKRLNQSQEKALFSVGAQNYIKNNGGYVPGVIANKANETITCFDKRFFIMSTIYSFDFIFFKVSKNSIQLIINVFLLIFK